jgi:perosamine synthetase
MTTASIPAAAGVPERRALARELPDVTEAAGRTLGEEEVAALTRVIASGMLSGVFGTEVKAFQNELAAWAGTRFAVAASSGTASLHLAIASIGLEIADEVITTPISDFGSVAPILAQNAVPVFADVDPSTGNIDPESVAALIGPRTRAILAVHLFGAPAPVRRLRELADEHGLLLIEDCAQAWGTFVGDARAGTIGHIGCLSLQQWKHITTGDGGVAITDSPELADRMRLFADKGWPRETGERQHVSFGLNYRMTELQGAVAREQLKKVDDVVARRRDSALRVIDEVGVLRRTTLPSAAGHSYWTFPVVVDVSAAERAAIVRGLAAEGVGASAGYLQRPLYANPALRSAPVYGTSRFPLADVPGRPDIDYPDGLAPVAEDLIARSLISVNWNENYTAEDVDGIVCAFRRVWSAVLGD